MHIENPKVSTKTLLEQINKFNKVAGYKVNVQKSVALKKKKKENLAVPHTLQDLRSLTRNQAQAQMVKVLKARISFGFDGEIRSFTDKQKLREFNISKPAL